MWPETQKGCLCYTTVSDTNHMLLPGLQHPPGFAPLHGDEGFLIPGSMGSHQTQTRKAQEPLSQGCGVGGGERQQATRYISATHQTLPNKRLFPKLNFPNKTQLNQETWGWWCSPWSPLEALVGTVWEAEKKGGREKEYPAAGNL